LAVAASIAQIITIRTGNSHGFHTAIVFVAAAALLLPPELIVLMAVIQHVPEWLKVRYPWFIQTFNIFNFIAAMLAAHAVARAIFGNTLNGPVNARWAAAGLAAVVILIIVNHGLLAGMLRAARGVRVRDGGLLTPREFGGDIVQAGLGIALAALLIENAWLVPALLAPLFLSHRSFATFGRLRDTEERFRTMFDSAPIGIIVRELDGTVVSANKAMHAMLASDLVTLEAHELHPELAAGETDRYDYDSVLIAADGREVSARVAVALVRDAGERPQFAIEMVQDVSQRKLLEDQLRQSQKMEAIGRLAGGVAHDFNNLLTAIIGYSDLLVGQVGDRETGMKADIGEIRKAADRAHGLTRQLLAFSRKQILEPQVLNLNDVVGDMDTMLRRLIGEDISVVTAYGSSLAAVEADPGQLHQVIVNLVVNSRDEMPEGGTLTIATANTVVTHEIAARLGSGARAGAYVTLTIRDTGNGMDAATKERLFEPFFTRKLVGKGTGLGLSTVDGIVSQSGGFIHVESEPDKGATFTVYLPAVTDRASSIPQRAPEPARPGSETILLVEDEEQVRALVQRMLESSGYSVLVAANGEDALALVETASPDLVLTDVVMPHMSGAELVKRLGGRAPVLFMTGYTAELVEHNGTSLLQKPFTAVELTRKIRELLDRAAADAA
ncbi:MAG: two-component system, cell cycle sensor histidine kinase and response regulator CckA, partial [Gaiellaceae bacterium]|nr:two-component system, cell cycle sensor histidine kinase and response regulator CckA [Gaiellaceae bacterium]